MWCFTKISFLCNVFSSLAECVIPPEGQVQLFPQGTKPPLQKDATPKLWAKGSTHSASLIYSYQKNRAGTSLHHMDSTLCQQPSQTEGPGSSLWHHLVLYTGTSSLTPQEGKQVPALFRWRPITPPSSQGAIVLLLCSLPPSFQAALISLCTGQACVWVGTVKPITQREDVDLLWEGQTRVWRSRREYRWFMIN